MFSSPRLGKVKIHIDRDGNMQNDRDKSKQNATVEYFCEAGLVNGKTTDQGQYI